MVLASLINALRIVDQRRSGTARCCWKHGHFCCIFPSLYSPIDQSHNWEIISPKPLYRGEKSHMKLHDISTYCLHGAKYANKTPISLNGDDYFYLWGEIGG